MKNSRYCLLFFFVFLWSCGKSVHDEPADPKGEVEPAFSSVAGTSTSSFVDTLSDLAERERRGRYEPGFGLFESTVRERAGDYTGAVFAAYKDLVYGYGRGEIESKDIATRLDRLESGFATSSGPGAASVLPAIRAARAFQGGDWQAVTEALRGIQSFDGQQDSFPLWMELTAKLEQSLASENELERYAIMQSRYALLPEYWFHFARAQKNIDLMRDSAERCIALAPAGPFAKDARSSIAASYGLAKSDGDSLLIPFEIESIATRAVQTGKPEVLEAMLPILGLADNPATLYAVGALRGLCASDDMRSWLGAKAATSRGRIAERLRYITGR